jgi:hypothetical protein
VWATISRRRGDGTLEQMDRGGNPTINPFINPDGEKDLYNSRQPADDVANYLDPWSKVLENGGPWRLRREPGPPPGRSIGQGRCREPSPRDRRAAAGTARTAMHAGIQCKRLRRS